MNSLVMRYKNYFLLEPETMVKGHIALKSLGTCYWDPESAYARYSVHGCRGKKLFRAAGTLDSPIDFKVPDNADEPSVVEIESDNYVEVKFDKPFGLIASKSSPLIAGCGKYDLYFLSRINEKTIITVQKTLNLSQRHQKDLERKIKLTISQPNGKVVLEKEGDYLTSGEIVIPSSEKNKDGVWSLRVEQLGSKKVRQDVFLTLNSEEPFFAFKKEWVPKLRGLLHHKIQVKPKGAVLECPFPLRVSGRIPLNNLNKKFATRPQIHYRIDYGTNHLDNPEYIDLVKTYKPDLLHFGRDVPMTHLFGPVPIVGGENSVPVTSEDLRLLSVEEVRKRITSLQYMNANLRKAGAKMIMPYIAAITAGGDPEKRKGIFEFLDRWDDYKELGIGRRPTGGPDSWTARKKDGSPYTWAYGPLAYPPYLGMNRYVCCINQPEWARWLESVVRLVAEAGYDGTFIDNGANYECFCDACMKKFRQYLRKNYSENLLKKLFGFRNENEIKLGNEEYTLLYIESKKFWSLSLRKLFIKMRRAGCKINPDFKLFPNLTYPYHMYPYLCDVIDYCMFEGGIREVDGAGHVFKSIAGDFFHNEFQDNQRVFRYSASIPGKLMPLRLGVGSEEGNVTKSGKVRSLHNITLELMEAAIYGRGSGIDSTVWGQIKETTPETKMERDKPKEFYDFIKKHSSLYEGMVSAAEIGVLNFPWQNYYPKNSHRSTDYLANELLINQVPFDFVSEKGIAKGLLRCYKYLFAVDVKYVSDEEVEKFNLFVKNGGTLIILGEFATHDIQLRVRKTLPFSGSVNNATMFGKGKIFRFECTGISTEYITTILQETGTGYEVDALCEGLSCMLYAQTAPLRKYVLHLLNYNIPLNYGDENDVSVLGTREIKMIIAENEKVKEIKYFDLDSKNSKKVDFFQDGAVVRFMVPGFDVYRVCEILI